MFEFEVKINLCVRDINEKKMVNERGKMQQKSCVQFNCLSVAIGVESEKRHRSTNFNEQSHQNFNGYWHR